MQTPCFHIFSIWKPAFSHENIWKPAFLHHFPLVFGPRLAIQSLPGHRRGSAHGEFGVTSGVVGDLAWMNFPDTAEVLRLVLVILPRSYYHIYICIYTYRIIHIYYYYIYSCIEAILPNQYLGLMTENYVKWFIGDLYNLEWHIGILSNQPVWDGIEVFFMAQLMRRDWAWLGYIIGDIWPGIDGWVSFWRHWVASPRCWMYPSR